MDAARRELYEEVGRDDLPIGPCIWRRTVTFTWEQWRVQQEEYTFLVEPSGPFEAVTLHPDEEPITGSAWLTIPHLRALAEVVVSGRPRGSPRAALHQRRAARADPPGRRGRGLTCRCSPLRSPDAGARDRRLAGRVPSDARRTATRSLRARSHRPARSARAHQHPIGAHDRYAGVDRRRRARSGLAHAPGPLRAPRPCRGAATGRPSHGGGRGRVRAGVHFRSRRKNHSRCSRQRPSGANRRWITPSYSTRIGSPTFCVNTFQWTKARSPSIPTTS